VRSALLFLASKNRRRISVTSLVGGMAATVVLGIVLRGETAALDVADSQVSVVSSPQPYTFAESPPPQVISTAPQAPASAELAPVSADLPKLEPPRAPRSIQIPEVPVVTGAPAARGAAVPVMRSGPLVALPTPPLPTLASEANPAPVPFTQPRVLNASRVQQALEREYPIGLRELGVGGKVEMAFYINEQGEVERYETKQGSGNADLDRAALKVAQAFEFAPAMRGDEKVPVWFSIAITFGNGRNAAPSSTGNPTNVVATAPNRGSTAGPNQPVASPFDEPPQVQNPSRVRQALEREYPIGLRASAVGGLVEMWFYIDERGEVERFQLKKSSGNADLDRAALRVAEVFEFSPGRRGGAPAAGWVFLGVAFAGNSSSGK
jgi:TonB family protein